MSSHITHESLPGADDAAVNTLIAALNTPSAFDHPVKYIRLIETHISWILLTGDYAYKIKKALDFGFLDFSTLEKRHFYCNEELRLNRRFAPQIYLQVVEIRGSSNAPRLHGRGEVVEYAVKMREFSQQSLLSAHAARGRLNPGLIDSIALTVSAIHVDSEIADPASDFGSAALAARWSAENIDHIARAIPVEYLPPSYFQLKRWYLASKPLLADIDKRKQDGFVRECHGDLHLGNMALLDDKVTFFDCIEFNPELRWIDTISEASFVAMDLQALGFPEYCWRFINRYLEQSGDYAGVKTLRYYLVYRALVRAKVAALRCRQEVSDVADYRRQIKPAINYLELANGWCSHHRAGLVIMHGLSGSGKSTVAAQLVEALGAIQIRSDVVRKQLFKLESNQASGSALGEGIYTGDASAITYKRLGEIAQIVIDAGFTVIVDATFLLEAQRRDMLELESSLAFNKIIVDCDVAEDELRARISSRKNDPSEANQQVLDQQLLSHQPISPAEAELARVVSVGHEGISATQIQEIYDFIG